MMAYLYTLKDTFFYDSWPSINLKHKGWTFNKTTNDWSKQEDWNVHSNDQRALD
jgi:hypothetical protein